MRGRHSSLSEYFEPHLESHATSFSLVFAMTEDLWLVSRLSDITGCSPHLRCDLCLAALHPTVFSYMAPVSAMRARSRVTCLIKAYRATLGRCSVSL
jgi:hypothetical protein